MSTPEAFRRKQQKNKRRPSFNVDALRAGYADTMKNTTSKTSNKTKDDDTASVASNMVEPTQGKGVVVKEIGSIADRRKVFTSGNTKVRNKSSKVQLQVAQAVKNRYMKEIKAVMPEIKKQFWADFTRKSGNHYNAVGVQGWREYMEDTYDAFHTRTDAIQQLFAVYDGHGGVDCAAFCESFLLKRLAMHADLSRDPRKAMIDTFEQINATWGKKAIANSSSAGTTATALYVESTPDLAAESKVAIRYYLGYVGDSRGILVKKDGSVVPLSDDHNLTRDDEKERVLLANGEIRHDEEFDESLVYNSEINRGLAVTRSIGDMEFKPVVTATPEVNEGVLDDDCAYICLASDGLWAKVSNEQAGNVLQDHGIDKGIDILADLSNARGIVDNITILAIDCVKLIEDLTEYEYNLE